MNFASEQGEYTSLAIGDFHEWFFSRSVRNQETRTRMGATIETITCRDVFNKFSKLENSGNLRIC
jgi:hypothetical protein